jgi:Ser/Thr protein kinase RdoA (MazF antagonist)
VSRFSTHPFEALTPEFVMDAVESQGYRCDCRNLTLNSYENRVYQIGIEEQSPLIAKFYRPERWSDEQIREEHAFSGELVEAELPVVAPLINAEGDTLSFYRGFRFSLFPRRGGHAPELDHLDNLVILGRLLGRMHLIGGRKKFTSRPALDLETFGRQSVNLISDQFIPSEYRPSYTAVTEELLRTIDEIFRQASDVKSIRVHGDCHGGNILWREDNPHFVDFDDARMAPAIQDIWMLLCGSRQRQTEQLDAILEGYTQFCDFKPKELLLAESLRSLRMLHHSAWLARRWEDPAFPASFPWFNTTQYWGEQILALREQLGNLQEPALAIFR